MNNKVLTILTHKPLQKLAQKPRVTKVVVSGLVLAPLALGLSKDVFIKEEKSIENTKPVKQSIPADDSLFSWAKQQPKLSMKEINPESMVWTHMTEYFPTGGRILSSRLATRDENGVSSGLSTIHGALNKAVTEHTFGKDWGTMSYAVIAPFSKILENTPNSRVLGGIQDDFFFQDNVELPEGSVVLKYNPEVEEGKFWVSELKKGVKLVETSNKNMASIANTVVKKMGYEVYNEALSNYLNLSDKEKEILFSIPEAEMLGIFNSIDSLGGAKKYREIILDNIKGLEGFVGVIPEIDLATSKANYERNLVICDLKEKYQEKMQDFPKAFENYCKEKGYHSGLHYLSSWAKCEFALKCTKMLADNNDNYWGDSKYKEAILNAIKVAKEILPAGKSLGFDSDRMYEIIKESETPQLALDNIEKELKIRPLPNRNEIEEIPNYAKDFVFDVTFAQFGLLSF